MHSSNVHKTHPNLCSCCNNEPIKGKKAIKIRGKSEKRKSIPKSEEGSKWRREKINFIENKLECFSTFVQGLLI